MGNTTRCGCTNRVLVVLLHDTEVLFLQTDWCQQLRMATTAPPPLPQRRSRRLRGQKPLSPSRRQVEEEWSGASPTPPSGGSPLSGAPPPSGAPPSPLLLEAVPDSDGVGVYQPVRRAAFSLWVAPDWSWLVCWWV